MDELLSYIKVRLHTLPISAWPAEDLHFQHTLTQAILCNEQDPADKISVERYFGPARFPGTTSIGFRKDHPDLFQDTTDSALEDFDSWVTRSILRLVGRMEGHNRNSEASPLSDETTNEIVQKFKILLEYQTPEGVQLRDAIAQQTYEDIFLRILLLISDDLLPGEGVNFYREFNAIGHRIALATINRIDSQSIEVSKVIRLAVLSGYVGINLKSSASAASTLLNRNFVPLKETWIQSAETVARVTDHDVQAVVDRLLMVCDLPEGQFELESLHQYQTEVVETRRPTLLVFFCDDYLESLIDLKRFELLLDGNSALSVLYIPRNGRYGNDIAYEDIPAVLGEPQFRNLQPHLASGRLVISPDGPRSGCIDPRCISRKLIDTITSCQQGKVVIFETKGCRNFEMLCGELRVPWYAGFNCNRALSIRTVGLDGPPVFFRIPPGLKAYQGFTQPNIGHSPSYHSAGVRYARMTTRQLLAQLSFPLYQSLLAYFGCELQLNQRLMDLSEQSGLPVNELLCSGIIDQIKA